MTKYKCLWEYIPQCQTECGELLHCNEEKDQCPMYKQVEETGWKESPNGQPHPMLRIDGIEYLIG